MTLLSDGPGRRFPSREAIGAENLRTSPVRVSRSRSDGRRHGGELPPHAHEQRLERELRRDVELLERAPAPAHDLGGALGAGHALGRRVLGQLGEAVVVDDRALGARRDDDEVAVPRRELLEREQDLLTLGAALGPLDVLLGLAVRAARARRPPPRRRPSPRRRARPRAPARPAPPRSGRSRDRRRRRARPRAAPPGGGRPRGRAGARPGRAGRPRRARPPSARPGERPGASRSTSARIARSDSRRNGTSWQRERIVSGSGPSSSATRTTTAYGGGSSRSLSSASAASAFSRCASKIR